MCTKPMRGPQTLHGLCLFMTVEITDQQLADAALKAESIETDGVKVKQRPIGDLIKAKERLANNDVARSGFGGITWQKMCPPGSV